MSVTKQEMFQAVENGKVDLVERLLAQGMSVNLISDYNESLLIIAVKKKQASLVNNLLGKNDIMLHIEGYLTGTALTFAIFSEQWNIAKALLAKEQKFDNAQHPGTVIWAVGFNNKEILELLRAKGANFDLPGLTGEEGSPDQDWLWKPDPGTWATPFHREHFLYLKHRPLYLAILNKKSDLVNFLLDTCKVNPNLPSPDENGILPLQLAAEQGDEEMVRILLKHGADPVLLGKYKPKEDEVIPDYLRTRRPKIKPHIQNILTDARQQKSVHNTPTVPTLFNPKPAAAPTPVKTTDLDEKVIELLRSNLELWQCFTNNPESWDDIQNKIKQAILKDSPRNNPSKPEIPVP